MACMCPAMGLLVGIVAEWGRKQPGHRDINLHDCSFITPQFIQHPQYALHTLLQGPSGSKEVQCMACMCPAMGLRLVVYVVANGGCKLPLGIVI
jgi:LSD1 subclass zinc finger protein